LEVDILEVNIFEVDILEIDILWVDILWVGIESALQRSTTYVHKRDEQSGNRPGKPRYAVQY
jgi:hypothetical protein